MAILDHIQARTGPDRARVWYGTPSALRYIDVPGGSNRQCADIAAERLHLGEQFVDTCAVTVIPKTQEEEELYRFSAGQTVEKNLTRWALERAREGKGQSI